MKNYRRKQGEKYLKNRIEGLRKQLGKICAEKGHDFEESASKATRLVGSRIETDRFTDCDHTHRCYCPVIERPRSVGNYEEVVTTVKRCKRCGTETTTEKRRAL